MSIFTMDLVCALSKYAGCYEDLADECDNGINHKIEVCRRDEVCRHRRIYSYEKIGELLFNNKSWIKSIKNQ